MVPDLDLSTPTVALVVFATTATMAYWTSGMLETCLVFWWLMQMYGILHWNTVWGILAGSFLGASISYAERGVVPTRTRILFVLFWARWMCVRIACNAYVFSYDYTTDLCVGMYFLLTRDGAVMFTLVMDGLLFVVPFSFYGCMIARLMWLDGFAFYLHGFQRSNIAGVWLKWIVVLVLGNFISFFSASPSLAS